MLTVYRLSLHPYEDELVKALLPGPVLFTETLAYWTVATPLLELTGTRKRQRLKVTHLTCLEAQGVACIRVLAKYCRGTIIGFDTASNRALYIENGQEHSVIWLKEKEHD